MCEHEFHLIWDSQAQLHPLILTPERKKLLSKAIFFQRQMTSAKHLVGNCELEPEERRAPRSLLIAQRFRLLQRVNDLQVVPPGEKARGLTPEERNRLLEALEMQGDLTFAAMRKLLALPRTKFNHARCRGLAGRWQTVTHQRTRAEIRPRRIPLRTVALGIAAYVETERLRR